MDPRRLDIEANDVVTQPREADGGHGPDVPTSHHCDTSHVRLPYRAQSLHPSRAVPSLDSSLGAGAPARKNTEIARRLESLIWETAHWRSSRWAGGPLATKSAAEGAMLGRRPGWRRCPTPSRGCVLPTPEGQRRSTMRLFSSNRRWQTSAITAPSSE